MSKEERLARNRELGLKYREANRERERERVREWAKANPEKHRERSQRWAEANRDKTRAGSRRWRQENHERALELGRKRREADPERNREGMRQWRLENPGGARAHVAIRRARKVAAVPDGAPRVTAEVLAHRRALFGNCCCYCGGPGPLHDDHFQPLARGGHHVPSNLVPACERCNLSKHSRPVEAWYLSQPFFSAERWEAILRHTSGSDVRVVQLSLLDLVA